MSALAVSAVSTIDATAKKIGAVLRRQREDRGRTPYDVAANTGLGAKTIKLIEDGRTDVLLDEMLKVMFSAGLDLYVPGSREDVPESRRMKTRLREVRRAIEKARRPETGRKLSFKAISDASGVEQGQIGSIVSGSIVPRFRTFLALAGALRIQVQVRGWEMPKTSGRRAGAPDASALRRARRRGHSAGRSRRAAPRKS